MEFTELHLKGAFLLQVKRFEDHRGFFGRSWCREEFLQHGLNPNMVQMNVGVSLKRGTLRGMHFQEKPHQEAKLIRCPRGAIYDVIIDLRPESPTRGQWYGTELSAANALLLYAPEGFAHGYQTLTDDAEMDYLTSAAYAPGFPRGVRYNDPAFNISWPLPVAAISDADQKYPDYRP